MSVNWTQWSSRLHVITQFVTIGKNNMSELHLFCSTVEALVSGHPREVEKMSATGAGRLRECK